MHFYSVFNRGQWLKQCVIFLDFAFSNSFFEEENVSTGVAYNRFDIFYLILYDKVIIWILLWATAADIVFCLKKYWRVLSSATFQEKKMRKCTFYDITITLVKV